MWWSVRYSRTSLFVCKGLWNGSSRGKVLSNLVSGHFSNGDGGPLVFTFHQTNQTLRSSVPPPPPPVCSHPLLSLHSGLSILLSSRPGFTAKSPCCASTWQVAAESPSVASAAALKRFCQRLSERWHPAGRHFTLVRLSPASFVWTRRWLAVWSFSWWGCR